MSEDVNFLRDIADVPATGLRSEEDVKVRIVLPFLRAFGYQDAHFGFEGRTRRGYVDVVVDQFPMGIVVETKSPRTRLDQCIAQLENYVFHKHDRDRIATLAILTDGEVFHVYGVTDAIRKGSLSSHQIITFLRSQLRDQALTQKLVSILSRENNQAGSVPEAIAVCREEARHTFARIQAIDAELTAIGNQREQLEIQRSGTF